jgi:hypothetical protein
MMGGQALVVASTVAMLADPGKRPLDHPSAAAPRRWTCQGACARSGPPTAARPRPSTTIRSYTTKCDLTWSQSGRSFGPSLPDPKSGNGLVKGLWDAFEDPRAPDSCLVLTSGCTYSAASSTSITRSRLMNHHFRAHSQVDERPDHTDLRQRRRASDGAS